MSLWDPAPCNPQIVCGSPLPSTQPHPAPSLVHTFMGRQPPECVLHITREIFVGRLPVPAQNAVSLGWIPGVCRPRQMVAGLAVTCDFFRSLWAQFWQQSTLALGNQLTSNLCIPQTSQQPIKKLPIVEHLPESQLYSVLYLDCKFDNK